MKTRMTVLTLVVSLCSCVAMAFLYSSTINMPKIEKTDYRGGWLNTTPSNQPARDISFDVHNGYFVSNKFEPNKPASFVVIVDQATFNRVFGVAFVMRDKSHRLPPKAFDTKMVMAAIKRGKAIWEFKVESVNEQAGVLTLRYTATSKTRDSAEYACPLIVSIPRRDYAAVQFVENGKVFKKIDSKGAAAISSRF
jgi:hypothetical protein